MSRISDPYLFGKAVAGGTPLSGEEMVFATRDQLAEMKQRLGRSAPARTEDPILLRLAEELAYAQRLLDVVGREMERRGLSDGPLKRQLIDAVDIIQEVAGIVAADNRRLAVEQVRSDDMRRRLLRGSVLAGEHDNTLPFSKS